MNYPKRKVMIDLNMYRRHRRRILELIHHFRAGGFERLVRKMRLDLLMYRQQYGLSRRRGLTFY